MKNMKRKVIGLLGSLIIPAMVFAGSTKTNVTISTNTPTLVLSDRSTNNTLRYSAYVYNAGPSAATVDRSADGCTNGLPLPVGATWVADPIVVTPSTVLHDSAPLYLCTTGTVNLIIGEEIR